jgi:UDP-N-acetylglucosamine acyltransferase
MTIATLKDRGNYIHPTAIISPNAIIGSNNHFGPYCVVYSDVEIGDSNMFTSHVSVGSPAEHKSATKLNEGVVIGAHNTFREFITVNQGTKDPTVIQDDCYLMRNVHIGHDAHIYSKVTLACNSIVGGHVVIHPFANIGLGAILHQNIIIAPGAMIGMGAIVTKNIMIEEWKTYAGNPAKFIKLNAIGKERSKLSWEQFEELNKNWIKSMIDKRTKQ